MCIRDSGQTPCHVAVDLVRHTLSCCGTSCQIHTAMLQYIRSDTHSHVAVHLVRHTTICSTSGQTHIAMSRYIWSVTYYMYLIRQTLLCFRVYVIRHCYVAVSDQTDTVTLLYVSDHTPRATEVTCRPAMTMERRQGVRETVCTPPTRGSPRHSQMGHRSAESSGHHCLTGVVSSHGPSASVAYRGPTAQTLLQQ